jgi:hypothetical protein
MIRGAERFFDRMPGLDTFKGSEAERFKQWFDSNTGMIAERPDFLRLHLSLSLLDEAESSARDISLSVRALALERLSLAFLPWLRELGIAEPERRSGEFAAMMLATVDGAFIAQQLGVATADAPMNTLYECLVARADQLCSSGTRLPE